MATTLDKEPLVPRLVHRLPPRLTAAVVAVVLIIAGLVSFGWWLTHPNVISPAFDQVTESGPVTIGVTYAQDTAIGARSDHSPTITVDWVHPIVATNTADATITIDLCRRRLVHLTVGTEPFSQVPHECTSVVPVAHQSIAFSKYDTQIIAVITAHRAGITEIHGFRIKYSRGWRRQVQTGGLWFRWTAHATAPSTSGG